MEKYFVVGSTPVLKTEQKAVVRANHDEEAVKLARSWASHEGHTDCFVEHETGRPVFNGSVQGEPV